LKARLEADSRYSDLGVRLVRISDIARRKMLRPARTPGSVKPHGGMPPTLNGGLGPVKTVIEPKQTDGIWFDAK
jgi:hypothetical protein